MPPTHKVEEEPDYRQTERSERNTARGLYWKRRSSSTAAWTCVSHRRPTQNRHVQVLYSFQSLTRWLHSVLYKSRGFFWAFPGSEFRACRVSLDKAPIFLSLSRCCVSLKWFLSVLSSEESLDVTACLSQALNYKTEQRSVGCSTSSVSIHYTYFCFVWCFLFVFLLFQLSCLCN